MTRACLRAASATVCIIAAIGAAPARATLEADPQVLFAQMNEAYAKAQANGWDYFDQLYYLSTIVNAGRAYSLQRPDDPNYATVAHATVQIGSALHYDPLINHDAATWYVREACLWVAKNSTDPAEAQQAQALLERVNAEDDDHALLARLADEDATALARQFPHDVQADVLPLEAAWRAYLLTGDTLWRSRALERAAQPEFPIASIPLTYGDSFVAAAQQAAGGAEGWSDADRANARVVLDRLRAANKLGIIGHATAVPEDIYLTRLAPADEYFGPLGMSVLGIQNEMQHVNYMLDYHYGNLEASDALQVALAIDDMHKVYPQDQDMAKLLLGAIRMLDRMTATATRAEAQHLRSILLVEYQDSSQAQQLRDSGVQ